MKTIVGEMRLWEREMRFDGRNTGRQPTQKRVKMGIGDVPQEHRFSRLCGCGTIWRSGALYSRDPTAIERVLAIFQSPPRALAGQPALVRW
jgi:branched-chain amino acid transport system ATP-binding protein